MARYDARAAGGRNHNMGRGQGNGRDVINPVPQTTTPNTPSDEDEISLLTPDTRDTRKPVAFLHCRRLLHGVRIPHEEGDTLQFKYDRDLKDLLSLAEAQNQAGWSWEEKYACDTRVEGIFFEVNVLKKNEGPTKFGDAAKGLATPQAITNETTREGDGLSNDSPSQEEVQREDAGRDAPGALTKEERNLRYKGPGRNLEAVNETVQNLFTPPIAREHVKGDFTLAKMKVCTPMGFPTMESGPAEMGDRVVRNRTVRDKSQEIERRSWAEAAGAAGKYQHHEEDNEEEEAQIQADEEFARQEEAALRYEEEMLAETRIREEASSKAEVEKVQKKEEAKKRDAAQKEAKRQAQIAEDALFAWAQQQNEEAKKAAEETVPKVKGKPGQKSFTIRAPQHQGDKRTVAETTPTPSVDSSLMDSANGFADHVFDLFRNQYDTKHTKTRMGRISKMRTDLMLEVSESLNTDGGYVLQHQAKKSIMQTFKEKVEGSDITWNEYTSAITREIMVALRIATDSNGRVMIRLFISTLDAQYRTDFEQEWYGAIMQAFIARLTAINLSIEAPEPIMRSGQGGGPGQGGPGQGRNGTPGPQGSGGSQHGGGSYSQNATNGGGKWNYGNKGANWDKKSQHEQMEDTDGSSYESLEEETESCDQEESGDTSQDDEEDDETSASDGTTESDNESVTHVDSRRKAVMLHSKTGKHMTKEELQCLLASAEGGCS